MLTKHQHSGPTWPRQQPNNVCGVARAARRPGRPTPPQGSGHAGGVTTSVPRTYGDMLQQARAALRRYREQQGAAEEQLGPTRLQLTFPLPVNPGVAGARLQDWPLTTYKESDWPGGYTQKFRALRTVVDALLEGYAASFLGMLEDPADGVGCWYWSNVTLTGIITNSTFSSLVKLCDGGYGARPQDPSHTIIAVNPEWTSSKDIGQPWSRPLKQRAKELVDDGPWLALYSCQVLRTARGRYGVLMGDLDHGWQLFTAAEDYAATASTCILHSQQQISRLEALKALAAAQGDK